VDEDQRADPFVPDVRRGGPRPQSQAVYRICRLPAVLAISLSNTSITVPRFGDPRIQTTSPC
jgi:hypothetical protein